MDDLIQRACDPLPGFYGWVELGRDQWVNPYRPDLREKLEDLWERNRERLVGFGIPEEMFKS